MTLSKPKSCELCPLFTLGHGFSEVEGRGASGVMVVGEALGDKEVRDGLPFRPDAPAGSVLQTAIKRSGLDREELSITNVVRCGPPGNKLENMPWENGAVAHCQRHMDPVVERARPKVIYALGNSAIKALTGLSGKARGSTSLRGYVLRGTRYPDIPIVAGLHPSYIARGARENIEVLRHDLLKAVGIAKGRKDYLFIETWEDAILAGLDYRRPGSGPRGGLTTKELEEFHAYISNHVHDHAYPEHPEAELVLAVDIETEMIKSRNRSEMVANLSDKIRSIQFSIFPNSGYFLPWVEPYIEWAKKLLALPVRKAGWNLNAFDIPILLAAGCEVNGEIFDGMTGFHHMQPDLLKDLQFAGSFLGARYPWDHLKDSQPELYGIADADNTVRAALRLPEMMKKLGIWDSYVVQVQGLRPTLDLITKRGLPVDEERLEVLGVELDARIAEVDGKCQERWPEQLRKYHPSEGYKVLPKPLKLALTGVVITDEMNGLTVNGELYLQRQFNGGDVRWCKPLPFLPNSPQQIQSYMKFRGHPIPKSIDGKDTTGTKELDRLAKRTKDPLYSLIGQYRKVKKMKSTYVGDSEPGSKSRGFRPEPDGRVRAYYTYNPATGQLATSGGPPLLTIPKHGPLAPSFRRCFHAEPGHKLVTFDYRGFHSLTTGFEANDPDYMRLARIDIHSFVTGHSLRLPGRENWLSLPDEELTLVLADIKKKHKAIRDGRIKNCIAEGQLVLTNKGLIPVERISVEHRLWDGVEWVTHDGVVYTGDREVITYGGLTATQNHEVYTQSGRQIPFGEAARLLERLEVTGIGRQEVRQRESYICGDQAFREWAYLHQGSVYPLQKEEVDLQRQPPQWALNRVLHLHSFYSILRSAWKQIRCGDSALQQSARSKLQTLWGAWNQSPVPIPQTVYRMGCEELAASQLSWSGNRQDRQQWALRAGEFETVYQTRANVEQAEYPQGLVDGGDYHRYELSDSLYLQLDIQVGKEGSDWRTNYQGGDGIGSSQTQELARSRGTPQRVRVYDILNAGPRHRFTVSGKLVGNSTHGRQFGLGPMKFFDMNRESFNSLKEVKELFALLDDLFPRVFVDYPKRVRDQAHRSHYLLSRYGYIRWFWEVYKYDTRNGGWTLGEDAEAALSFFPSNDAFGMARDALLDVNRAGSDQKYELVNYVHDELVFHCPESLIEACVADIRLIMEKPSQKLRSPLVPDGLICQVDAGVGGDLASVEGMV